jgi:hypothetical protein
MPAISVRRYCCIHFLGLPFIGPTPLRLTYKSVSLKSPRPFSSTYVPSSGGLYAVMVRDAACSPLPYRLIYAGKAGSLSQRVCGGHEKYLSWERAARGAQLFVAFYLVGDESTRTRFERRIIQHYQPECNETFNHNATVTALSELYAAVFKV